MGGVGSGAWVVLVVGHGWCWRWGMGGVGGGAWVVLGVGHGWC